MSSKGQVKFKDEIKYFEYEKIIIIDYNNEYSKLVELFNGD